MNNPEIPMMSVELAEEGKKVLNPSTSKKLEFGTVYEVPDAPYWHRRIKEGSVKRVKKTKKTESAETNPVQK